MRTAVIVLGDLGRSPRMQYHAVSLAADGADVDLIGLEGAPVVDAVASEPRIHVHRLADRRFATRASSGLGRFVFGSALRAFSQAWGLFRTLTRVPAPQVILVQTPPAVPTLFIAWVVSRLRGARLVIDWHNLSHTIAAMKVGDDHRAVKAIARSERRWARRGDAHLTVSNALAEWLAREYAITAAVVYDRPAAAFVRPDPARAQALWATIAADTNLPATRIPIAVCPTSWTPDENFDLLLDALDRVERQLEPSAAPQLAVILTGRGELREAFEARVARWQFRAVAVRTLWLEPADYPVLIGMADLGLCLHQSSSGLDLPMKLADLRGAGVPVAAYAYAPVISEAITPGHEGLTFTDADGLARVLIALATSLAADPNLARSRAWLAQNPAERWDVQWQATARAVLLK